MDDAQSDHLKAYGVAYRAIQAGLKAEWLLNYRGGAFLVPDAGALRRVFGTAAHAAIPRVEQLPTVVGPLFRSALRSADLQRRVFQRRERTRERLGVERRTA